MKIKFPTNGEALAEMVLCGQGRDEGSFIGMVPMSFVPKAGLTFTAEKQVRVTSSTTANKRGVRSGVIKVTLPYTSIIADGNGGYVVDQSRSGADLSVHIVVAMPATAAADMRSMDSTVSKMAEQHVALALHLLAVLLQGAISTPMISDLQPDSDTKIVSGYPAAEQDPDADWVSGESGNQIAGGVGGILPTVSGYQTNGGLAAGGVNTVSRAARNLIGRIARNLPALSGCDDIDAVGYRLDSTGA